MIGGGKELAPCGPVRAGVTQTFVSTAQGARAGSCAVYTATNAAGPGGWCAKGKRFAEALDLTGHEAVAFWLRGDGRGETLRFQFRDAKGAPADWLVPIDFVGWRLQVLRLADRPDFDWGKVEYLIVYFNDIPADTTVSMGFDDVRAFRRLRPPPALVRPTLTVNDQQVSLPVTLEPGHALTLDDQGRAAVWPLGPGKPQPIKGRYAPLSLQPGENGVTLSCDAAKGAQRDVTVRLAPVGPME